MGNSVVMKPELAFFESQVAVSSNHSPSPRQLVSTRELAEIWGIPESTLRYWRSAEIGPPPVCTPVICENGTRGTYARRYQVPPRSPIILQRDKPVRGYAECVWPSIQVLTFVKLRLARSLNFGNIALDVFTPVLAKHSKPFSSSTASLLESIRDCGMAVDHKRMDTADGAGGANREHVGQ